jgi:hypothetical protein
LRRGWVDNEEDSQSRCQTSPPSCPDERRAALVPKAGCRNQESKLELAQWSKEGRALTVNVTGVIWRGLKRQGWHRASACEITVKLGSLVTAKRACASVQWPRAPVHTSMIAKPLGCHAWMLQTVVEGIWVITCLPVGILSAGMSRLQSQILLCEKNMCQY